MKKKIFFSVLFIVGLGLGANNVEAVKKYELRLEVPGRSAESADSEAKYRRIKRWSVEPEPEIVLGGYFEEPEFIKPPEIIKETEPEDKKEPVKEVKEAKGSQKLKSIALSLFKAKARYASINGSNVRIDTDCSQFVRSVYWKAFGKDLFQETIKMGYRTGSGCELLYYYMKQKARVISRKQIPAVGDIIFFNNTYDRNRNNRFDDPLTHVGLVTDSKKNGQVEFVHANVGRPKAIYHAYLNVNDMNLFRKGDAVLNSYLQARYRWDRRSRSSTAAELVHSFGGIN